MMPEMNLDQARFNMIEQQIRPWDVLDPRVLEILADTPREAFVPVEYRNLAFADTNIPMLHDQVMMAPKVEGRVLQALSIQSTDSAWEIGTGSGYLTACMAKLAKRVSSVEIYKDLSAAAKERLSSLGQDRVTLQVGDALAETGGTPQYDVIAVTGSLPLYPEALQDRLTLGGRMFVIVGESPVMEAFLITRLGDRAWARESIFETDLPPLIHAPQPQRFVF